MAYEEFAQVYDLFNEDADYDALFSYVQNKLCEHEINDGIVADLGCGTGELTLRLAEAGYDMIGLDLSADMLSVLREKMDEANITNVLLLQQNLAELDLYGTIRAAVSTFDTLNHIAPNDLKKTIAQTSLFMEKGGIFVFDMNTPYKNKTVLANHTYEFEADEASCVWKNSYDEKNACTHISIEVQYSDGERYTESFDEYIYTCAEIKMLCEAAGLRVICTEDGEVFAPLTQTSQRFVFTALKL